ncbi:MAG: hypothetical protein JW946_05580 [Candidatus Omnitrophica bacterium]|nr:hypothetical protein [Candidatus Omnitrophota bacterium]
MLIKKINIIVWLCAAINVLYMYSAIAENQVFNFKFTPSVKEGYERNVFLDSSRKGDSFTQPALSLDANYKITPNLKAGIEYDFTGLFYGQYTDLDVVNNEAAAFFAYDLMPNLSLKAGYGADSNYYLNDKTGTYLAYGPLSALQYYFNKNLFLKAGYDFRIYDYDKKLIRDGSGRELGSHREDHRHTVTFTAGQRINKILLRLEERIDFNDSNDEYMDYYDYTAYKTGASFTAPVLKNLYLTAYGSYRYKDFTSRRKLDLSAVEKQKTMTLGASAYYKVYKSCYVNIGYAYMQNYSNEPLNRYSDSAASAGARIFF